MKQPKYSLAFYIYIMIIVIAAGVLGLFLLSNGYAVSALRVQTYNMTHQTLSMYSSYIDESFNNAQRFLSGFGYNDEDLPLINSENGLSRYTALAREYKNLQESLPSHSWIDSFFLYNPKYDLYAASVQAGFDETERNKLRQEISSAISSGDLQLDPSGNWIPFEADGNYYLIRLIYFQGTYVGAIVKAENLLESLLESLPQPKPASTQPHAVAYLYHDTFGPLTDAISQELDFDPAQAAREYALVGTNGRYLAVSCSCIKDAYYLIALIPDASIRTSMGGMYDIIILAGVLLILLLIMMSVAVRQLFIRPMKQLTTAIQKIRDGKLGTTVDEWVPAREFWEVNRSFNEMSAEIKRLTISVYEQKLQHQQIYQEYLKQQITPHFYINCLNTIYSMAGLGKNDLVRRLAKELSVHLRYTMNSQAAVSMKKEIDHVRNYLSLTELRYPNTLQYELEIQPETDTAQVPPLMIQTFIENTIKHETVPGEPMEIHLSVSLYWQGSERKVHVCIWDTGRGYPQDVLQRLIAESESPMEDYQPSDGTHIGLSNTIQRIWLLYDGKAEIHFSNREGAGAQCDILLPFVDLEKNISDDGQL